MNKQFFCFFGASAIIMAFTACGDDVTKVTENNVGVQSFESQNKFPNCTSENSGEMAIANDEGLVYYCDDSKWKTLNGKDGKPGENGKDGQPGENCNAKSVENGIEISCGGEVIGTIENGVDGNPGEPGKNGKDGSSVQNCSIQEKTNGVVTITCGENSVNLYKALCGTESYDPKSKFCFENKIYSLCGGKSYNPNDFTCVNSALSEFVTDSRDNKKYAVTKIGDQIWMAENLNYRMIFEREGDAKKDSGSFCYGDNGVDDRGTANCEKYGRLYTWAAAMDSLSLKNENITCGVGTFCDDKPINYSGLCPSGFRLPNLLDFLNLISYINNEQQTGLDGVGTLLKTTTEWKTFPDISLGTDFYSFSAFPSGILSAEGFTNKGEETAFWSISEISGGLAYRYVLRYDVGLLSESEASKENAYSVRCIKISD